MNWRIFSKITALLFVLLKKNHMLLYKCQNPDLKLMNLNQGESGLSSTLEAIYMDIIVMLIIDKNTTLRKLLIGQTWDM